MKQLEALGLTSTRRGASLLTALALTVVVAGLSLALLAVAQRHAKEGVFTDSRTSGFFVAEAGIQESLALLAAGESGAVGTALAPRAFAGGTYWVDATPLGADLTSIVATANVGDAQFVHGAVARTFEAPFFIHAAFGEESLELGSGAMVDSWSSDDGSYVSQATNTMAPFTYAGTGGHVASNGQIDLASNTAVYGDASAGPHQPTSMGSGAHVAGSNLPLPREIDMPAIDVPVIASSGTLSLGVGNSVVVPPGDHAYDAIDVGGNSVLMIQGPATLVVEDFEVKSNAVFIIDATNGPVEIFGTGDFILNSNSVVQVLSDHAADVSVQLTGSDDPGDPNHATIALDANSDFTGTIYAPNSALKLSSNMTIFGAIKAKAVALASNSNLHFDTALLDAGGGGTLDAEIVYWDAVTGEEPSAPTHVDPSDAPSVP